MSSTMTHARSGTARAAENAGLGQIDRAEMEPALWLFLSAPLSFAATLLIIMYMSSISF